MNVFIWVAIYIMFILVFNYVLFINDNINKTKVHITYNDYPHCTGEASERLNLNNVAKVERKESLLALPRHSNVSQKPHTRKSPIFAVWGLETTP